MHFASFLSGGFITAIVVNTLDKNLVKRTFVHCVASVYAVWPVYIVKCLSMFQRGATPTSISKFDSFDIKTL